MSCGEVIKKRSSQLCRAAHLSCDAIHLRACGRASQDGINRHKYSAANRCHRLWDAAAAAALAQVLQDHPKACPDKLGKPGGIRRVLVG